MRAWLDNLRVLVKGERISVRSELPYYEAIRWLGLAVTAVSPEKATIRRRSAPTSTGFRGLTPTLRGTLVPDGEGCRFDGVVDPDPVERIFLLAMTCLATIAFLSLTVAAIVNAIDGQGETALGLAGGAGFAALIAAVVPAGVLREYAQRNQQISHLRSWITGALGTPWYGGPRDR